MKIVCIDKENLNDSFMSNITVGKSYVICEYFDDNILYNIENDKGNSVWYAGNRFVTLKEYKGFGKNWKSIYTYGYRYDIETFKEIKIRKN